MVSESDGNMHQVYAFACDLPKKSPRTKRSPNSKPGSKIPQKSTRRANALVITVYTEHIQRNYPYAKSETDETPVVMVAVGESDPDYDAKDALIFMVNEVETSAVVLFTACEVLLHNQAGTSILLNDIRPVKGYQIRGIEIGSSGLAVECKGTFPNLSRV